LAKHKLKHILILNNLTNKITETTRITSSATLLDPIAISNNIKIPHAGVQRLDSSISDTSGTYVYIYFNYPDNKTYQRRVWNYKRADYMTLNDLINNYDWSVLNPLDTNLATRTFTNIFMTMIKQCIPNYLVTIRTDDKPWYNNELRKHSRQRDRTKKIATISGKISD